jgi:hypothetical protein
MANKNEELLNDLKQLIQSMSIDEVKLARQYLKFFYSDFTPKYAQLFVLVLNNFNGDSEALKGTMNETSIGLQRIIERLTEKLTFLLTSELNLNAKSNITYKLRREWELQQKIIAAQIFIKRGILKHAIKLLNQSIEIGKEVEDYSNIKKAITYRYIINESQNGPDKKKPLPEILAYYDECDLLLKKTLTTNTKYLNEAANTSSSINVEEWISMLEEIQQSEIKTQSSTIRNLHLQLQVTFAILCNDYKRAESYSFELYKFIESTPILNHDIAVGIANLIVAQSQMFISNYESSLEYLQIARRFFVQNSFNYLLCDELQFKVHFFAGEYDEAEKSIRKIIHNSNYTKSNFLESKKEYYLAYCLFANGGSFEVTRLLSMLKEIHQDKTGWNLGIRVLKALVFIEHEMFDLLDTHLAAYERDLSYIKKKTKIRERELYIFRVLNDFSKHHSFIELTKRKAYELEQLAGNLPQYVWHKHSHELIPVHEWIYLKAEQERKDLKSKNRKS